MPILRINDPADTLFNLVRDPELSPRACYLLIYLLGKSDDYEMSIPGLVSELKDRPRTMGRDAIYSAMNELIRLGYVKREQLRDKGTMNGYRYCIYDVRPEGEEEMRAITD